MALHETVGFSMARQANKGTAAVGPFVTGRMQRSSSSPVFDQDDPSGEHRGIHQRATSLQSAAQRTGYMAQVRAGWRLYPQLVGYGYLGVGYEVQTRSVYTLVIDADGGTFTLSLNLDGAGAQVTAAIDFDATAADILAALQALSNLADDEVTVQTHNGVHAISIYAGTVITAFISDATLLTGGAGTAALVASGAYSHRFYLPDLGVFPWLTLLSASGEAANRWERVIQDVLFSNLTVLSENNGLTASVEGMGLRETVSGEGQVRTAEPDAALNPATGYFTLTSSDITAATLGNPRRHEIVHTNPYDDREQEIHSFFRADAAPQGVTLSGTLGGLIWSEDPFAEFVYGSSSGLTPDLTIPEAALDFSWQSPEVIPGELVKNSLRYQIPVTQVSMEAVEFTGGGRILYDATWQMIDRGDASVDPVIVTLINGLDTYAGT